MNEYDKKYGIDSSTKAVKGFHTKRTMFAIKDGKVYVAPKGSTDTHAVWFEKLGWITPENDELMETIPRGFAIDDELYCYVGYDFKITDECEAVFLSKLGGLRERLKLSLETKVYGGMVKGRPGEKFKPIKFYGKLEELMKS